MFKIDDKIIQDRLSGVSFQFLIESEIKKLSVVQVNNLQTFDHLDVPNANGLHDKRMGVSPFDRTSACPTCGLTSNYCVGHHGHIELVAPIYNPFMIKELYRLMKSKCFHCHKLRINGSKINVFINSLKLIKAGEIIGSQKIKMYSMSLAREMNHPKFGEEDPKKLAKIKNMLNKIVKLQIQKKYLKYYQK